LATSIVASSVAELVVGAGITAGAGVGAGAAAWGGGSVFEDELVRLARTARIITAATTATIRIPATGSQRPRFAWGLTL